MKLLTKEILKKLPPLYSQDDKGDDALAVVKFFNPTGAATWYATEGGPVCPYHGYCDCQDPECGAPGTWDNFMFFGLVQGQEEELGYFTLKDLTEFRGQFGLGIERDLYFQPKTIGGIRGK